jgi:hypothetical protein
MDAIVGGDLAIPESIMRGYLLVNDIDPRQQASYADLPVTTAAAAAAADRDSSGGGDDTAATAAVSVTNSEFEAFTIRDYRLAGCADEMPSPPSMYKSRLENFVVGKDKWPSRPPANHFLCTYDGHPITPHLDGPLARYPEEWDASEGTFKVWGYWSTWPAMIAWTLENNRPLSKLALCAIYALMAHLGLDDPLKIGRAPAKEGTLFGYGGDLDIRAYRSLAPNMTSIVITDPKFIPIPVINSIDRYNTSMREAADDILAHQPQHQHQHQQHQPTADAFTMEQMNALRAVVPQHIDISPLHPGVWFDTESRTWIDVHNAADEIIDVIASMPTATTPSPSTTATTDAPSPSPLLPPLLPSHPHSMDVDDDDGASMGGIVVTREESATAIRLLKEHVFAPNVSPPKPASPSWAETSEEIRAAMSNV